MDIVRRNSLGHQWELQGLPCLLRQTVSISGVRHHKNPPTGKDFLRENETSISDSVRDLRENNQ